MRYDHDRNLSELITVTKGFVKNAAWYVNEFFQKVPAPSIDPDYASISFGAFAQSAYTALAYADKVMAHAAMLHLCQDILADIEVSTTIGKLDAEEMLTRIYRRLVSLSLQLPNAHSRDVSAARDAMTARDQKAIADYFNDVRLYLQDVSVHDKNVKPKFDA